MRKFIAAAFMVSPFFAFAGTLSGRVVAISDSDTITVLDADNTQYKMQLSGIDAPEKKQAFGQRAKERLSNLVFDKQAHGEWNKRDRYQRIIGKVTLPIGD